jgi:hypothetical protein
MRPAPWVWLLVLALAACLLNCVKPLAVDDAVYSEYAHHIADHPLDPYGFTHGANRTPANSILAPAGFLYYWAGMLWFVGERLWLWKAGLFPFHLLLTFSVYALARRAARGLELPLVALIVLSPAVLPCWNLMLDLPALALSLAALVGLLWGCERGSRWPDKPAPSRSRLGPVLLAGLLGGLALETKYTSFVTPPLLLFAAILYRQPGKGLLAAGLAGAVFLGWEGLLVRHYGQSHFQAALAQRPFDLREKLHLVAPLVGLLGGVAWSHVLLLAGGLTRHRWLGWLQVALVSLGWLAVAFIPDRYAVLVPSANPGRPGLTITSLVTGGSGVVLLAVSAAGLVRLLRQPGSDWTERRWTWLLLGWMGLELAGYFVLSPYPAVRRVLGLVVVGALLSGHLAARHLGERSCRDLVRLAVVAGGIAGLLAFAVDLDLYRVEKRGAEHAWRRIRRVDTGHTIWYRGEGAFEFQATRVGMRQLDAPGVSPQPGDWLVLPRIRGGTTVPLPIPPGWTSRGQVALRAGLPWRSGYQVGGSALEHQEGPFFVLALARYEP